jgi:hypothetical protein
MNECLRFRGSPGKKSERKSPLLCLRVRVLKVLKDLKGRKMDENVFVREGRKHVKTGLQVIKRRELSGYFLKYLFLKYIKIIFFKFFKFYF